MQKNLEKVKHSSFAKRMSAQIWDLDLRDQKRSKRLLIESARIFIQVVKDIWNGQLTLRAMSLVYTTLISLVPLLAISFSILKGFGVHREIEPFLITFLAPLGDKAEEIALRFVEFIDNTSVSALGYIGFAMLFYAVISLMQKVERTFNFVWRVEHNRSLPERVRDYLTLIIIGPTLMFAATGIWATLMGTNFMESVAGVAPLGVFLNTTTRILPVALVIVAFTFVYTFVPNTDVRWRPALIGGVISGLLWNAGGVGFAVFVGNSANYPTIYSGFATAVFFMIWLYLAWMILLVGSTISFYIQNPYLTHQTSSNLSIRMREKLAFAIAATIGERYSKGNSPHSAKTIAEELRLPLPAVESVIEVMVSGGILVRVNAAGEGYVPARSWEAVPVSSLITSIRTEGEASGQAAFTLQDDRLSALWERFENELTSGVADLSLKDLAESVQPKSSHTGPKPADLS